ncbi:hypothetical protein MOQ72_02670 [Saccharopolyspora sp. K220]|uniref:hypothetical protein n=1 Tax=Saccharopolyspora soli TaxID=2926618 RepID=UPI001F571F4A|nr:hypothetical protein [Saccharopolyspora soli]MCI2416314.1 hypothetical protein [Saccharopolyspora soli]
MSTQVQRERWRREAKLLDAAAAKVRKDAGPAIALADAGQGPMIPRSRYNVASLLDALSLSMRNGELGSYLHAEALAFARALLDEPTTPVG